MSIIWFIIILAAWTVIGTGYYLNLTQQVRFRLQRFVLILVGGPLVWVFKILDMGLDGLDIFFVGPYRKFERWLTKN